MFRFRLASAGWLLAFWPATALGQAAAPPSASAEEDELEVGAKPAAPARVPAEDNRQVAANLERAAHSRPVPKGLSIGGYVQGQFELNQLSEDQQVQGGEPLNQDRFSLRRARLRLDRGWDYAAGTLELDASTTAGPRVGIRRAEASLLYRGGNPDDLPPLLMVTIGVTDLPFGYELLESARVRAFMERSVASLALFPTEMDAGLKVSGATGFLRYAVAITNGEPLTPDALPRDPNASKDFSGRFGFDVDASERFGVSGGASFATGKGFHPGREATKDQVGWRDLNEDGIATSDEFYGIPRQEASPSVNFGRWVLGADLQLELDVAPGFGTKLYAEGYVAKNHDRGLFGADPIASGSDQREVGYYVALLQRLTAYGIVGFRAAYYDPNSDFLEQRQDRRLPVSQGILTLSPLIGAELPDRARLLFQYDFVRDKLARDDRGVPTDAKNDQFTARLQVDL